jgi:DNA-binding response OmpR family regulator
MKEKVEGEHTMSERILIIEDEENIARVLQLELEFEGYTTGIAYSGTDGLIIYREQSWDLVLLDLMLPGLSGLDVLRRIRADQSQVPVILLTAKNSVDDKVSGLDLGANDYVTKPFQMEELLARIRANLRMKKRELDVEEVPDLFNHHFKNLTLHEQTREVNRDERKIDLTPREFDLLLHLMKHPNQVLSREQLLDSVWGYNYYGETNVVDVYIRYLRKKIDFNETHKYIQTVRGVGYVLKEQSDEIKN